MYHVSCLVLLLRYPPSCQLACRVIQLRSIMVPSSLPPCIRIRVPRRSCLRWADRAINLEEAPDQVGCGEFSADSFLLSNARASTSAEIRRTHYGTVEYLCTGVKLSPCLASSPVSVFLAVQEKFRCCCARRSFRVLRCTALSEPIAHSVHTDSAVCGSKPQVKSSGWVPF